MSKTAELERRLANVKTQREEIDALNDLALQHLAAGIRQGVRAADIAARFGGDEFVILLPQTDGSQAVRVAERLREYLLRNPVVIEPQVFIEISIGIVSVSLPDTTLSVDTLLEEADGALYKAKQTGRNQVYLHEN